MLAKRHARVPRGETETVHRSPGVLSRPGLPMRAERALLWVRYFLPGACALAYENFWTRQLSISFEISGLASTRGHAREVPANLFTLTHLHRDQKGPIHRWIAQPETP